MGTFGETGTSAAYRALAADESRVYKATLGSTQKITRLVAYVSGGGATGSQVAKAVVYTDSSGPNTLVATSAEVTITSGQAAGWVTFALASPVTLTAASYWLGLITGATGANIYLFGNTGTVAPKYVSDTYSDGPATTWSGGTNEVDPANLCVYADYGTGHTAAVAFDGAGTLTAAATLTDGRPVISAPIAASSHAAGNVAATATVTHGAAADVYYEWEVDTVDPPAGGANYQQIFTGYNASGTAVSIVLSSLGAGTWYVRVRGGDGTSTSGWTATRTFYVFETILLRPGSNVTRSILGLANKVWAKVEGTSTTASATNSDAAYPPTYASSPRETLILMKAGDATAAQAVADAALAFRKVERYAISGLSVRLSDGIKIDIGDMVAVSHALSGIDGWYPVRRITHDFAADVSTLDVGDVDRPPDDESLMVKIAADLEAVKKDVA